MKRPAQSCKAVFAASFFLLATMGIVQVPAYGAGQPTFVYAAASNTGQVFGYTVDSTTGSFRAGSRLSRHRWFDSFCAGLDPFK